MAPIASLQNRFPRRILVDWQDDSITCKIMAVQFLDSVDKIFRSAKTSGEKAIAQAPDDGLFWQYNLESNSIAMIVQHVAGNMLSRWTDFRTTDGEKEWRDRDAEFEVVLTTRAEVIARWEQGWQCLFEALASIKPDEFDLILNIRGEAHTYMEAILRQLYHYPYHVGQMVYIAKMLADEQWQTMTMPRKKN